jgi:prevent-host-death family protein
MRTVSVAEAKNHLSELIARVEAGEDIAVTRHAKPVARLVQVEPGADPQARGLRVREAHQALGALRARLVLEGDLKAIARDGLD